MVVKGILHVYRITAKEGDLAHGSSLMGGEKTETTTTIHIIETTTKINIIETTTALFLFI